MKKRMVVLSSLLMIFLSFQTSAAILYNIATACTWTYGRADGSIISTVLKLTPTGLITGYFHPNEYSWKIEDGNLLFVSQDGRVSTSFTSAAVNPNNGRIILRGNFLLESGYIHTLTCHQ